MQAFVFPDGEIRIIHYYTNFAEFWSASSEAGPDVHYRWGCEPRCCAD